MPVIFPLFLFAFKLRSFISNWSIVIFIILVFTSYFKTVSDLSLKIL